MNFFDYGFGDFTQQPNQNTNPNPGADLSTSNIFNAFNFKEINNQSNNNQYMQQQPQQQQQQQQLYQQSNNNPYNNISYSIQPPQNNFIANNNNINLLQTPLKENSGGVGAAEPGN